MRIKEKLLIQAINSFNNVSIISVHFHFTYYSNLRHYFEWRLSVRVSAEDNQIHKNIDIKALDILLKAFHVN